MPRAWGILPGILALAGICVGQTPGPPIQAEACPPGVNFEGEGYTVSHSTVADPFDFLPWIHARNVEASAAISKLVDGQPFRYDTAANLAIDLLNERDRFTGGSPTRVRIRLETLSLKCIGHTVELTYRVFSSAIAPVGVATPEVQQQLTESPASAAESPRVAFTPAFGFDATDKFYSGGRLAMTPCGSCRFPLDFIAEGKGSQALENLHAALRHSSDFTGFIAHADWLLNYNLDGRPTGAGTVRQKNGSLQFTAATRPFLEGNLSARFGALLARGDAQAHLSSLPPAGAPAASPLNELKLYGGFNSRLSHNLFSASVGVELGAANVAAGPQWKRYLADVQYDLWRTLHDHYSTDINSRFTAGALQSRGGAPVAERFFGGNYATSFLPNDDWQLRDAPVIRAIPGSRLLGTGDGAGNFAAYNLTAAFSVWRKPLVPPEVAKDRQVRDLLNGQIDSATSVEQIRYASKSTAFQEMVAALPETVATLTSLTDALAALQQANPNLPAADFASCRGALRMALYRAKAALTPGSQQYGRISALLPIDPGEDRLNKVLRQCGAPGATTGLDLTALRSESERLDSAFGRIDQAAAKKKAQDEMVFVRRVVNSLFDEVNLVSVSPVAVFDIARIGPETPGTSGMRYGPGGGIRMDLASSVHFMVGYARNLKPGAGEGSGAIFFEMGLRDLFH